MTEPSSPPAARLERPRWRDVRLLAGVLLVLLAVVLGARILAAADDTVSVWVATADLAPGTTITAADVRAADVRLGDLASGYVSAGVAAPSGWVVVRPVAAGELVPADALAQPGDGPDLREVTVAVETFRAPADLARGQRVDVYVTPDDGLTRAVLSSALVADVVTDGGRLGPSGSGLGVVLAVAPEQVTSLVQASSDGVIDLVLVP